jgi:hypothetical protein
MDLSPHLHVAMPHVDELADFLVLLLPIFRLTSLGTIQGGLALSAVLELNKIHGRCDGATDDADLGHDYCWSGVGHDCCWSGVKVMECKCSVM